MTKHRRVLAVKSTLIATFTFMTIGLIAEDWSVFRGKNGSSSSTESVPAEWLVKTEENTETKNIAWSVDLPGRGLSGPIVSNGFVIVTANTGPKQKELHFFAFDEITGEQRWHRTFEATGLCTTFPTSANATPTPVSDGKYVVGLFSSNDLVCLDMQGNLQWMRALYLEEEDLANSLGMSSSPVIADGNVIVQAECDTKANVFGIDLKTGKNSWVKDRKAETSWSSPTVVQNGGESRVLLVSNTIISCIAPEDGKEIWNYEGQFVAMASCATDGKSVYVPGREGVKLDAWTKDSSPEALWTSQRIRSFTPSFAVQKNWIVGLGGPILTIADTATGEEITKIRTKSSRISATPVIAGDRVYLFGEDGKAEVVKLDFDNNSAEVEYETDMGQRVMSTPAIANGAIFVRGDSKLWKIAKSE